MPVDDDPFWYPFAASRADIILMDHLQQVRAGKTSNVGDAAQRQDQDGDNLVLYIAPVILPGRAPTGNRPVERGLLIEPDEENLREHARNERRDGIGEEERAGTQGIDPGA